MTLFKHISSNEPLKEVIKAAFDTDLPVSGGWGYDCSSATVLENDSDAMQLSQLQHMLASMRAYLEMNMTLPEEERYGSINLNEKKRETIEKEGRVFHKVDYEISAMKESEYAKFIDEYKEGYGKDSFDMEAHFQRRKEATLIRQEPYWFEVTNTIKVSE